VITKDIYYLSITWNWRAVACPIQGEVQQGGTQIGVPKGIARERNMRRMFKILRKV